MRTKRSGLTVVEVIVVLFILVVGGVLVIGYFVTRANVPSSYTEIRSLLKNLAYASRVAEVEMNRLPPAWGAFGRPPKEGAPLRTTSAIAHLLPYLEYKALFDKGDFSNVNVRVLQANVWDPSLPASPAGHTSFVTNLRAFSKHGTDTKWNEPIDDLEKCRDTDLHTERFLDGAGNTVLFTTKYAVCNGTHNRFYLSPWDASNGGPFFGAGSHAGGSIPASDIPTGQKTRLPSYQITPSLAAAGKGVCNNDRGLFGHSFGGIGLAIVMGDTSVRNLSFTVRGDTIAKALCPNDGQPLGSDW